MSRKHLYLAALLVVVVLTLAFVPVSSQQSGSYDAWTDLNDDGIIDIYDLQALAFVYGTSGTALNKTGLLLDLLDRVEALENQSGLPTPDYDSSWVRIPWNTNSMTISHDLGTLDVIADVQYKTTRAGYGGIQQRCWDTSYGGGWFNLNTSHVGIATHAYQSHWAGEYDCYFRIRMWTIR